jgi:hypothetical protein
MDLSSLSIQRGAGERPDWFAAIYQAMDAALGRGDGNVPPGTLATLYRALDGLREIGGCEAHIARGSAMVVTLHRLQAMLRHGGDRAGTLPLRRDLETMQRDWLMTTTLSH